VHIVTERNDIADLRLSVSGCPFMAVPLHVWKRYAGNAILASATGAYRKLSLTDATILFPRVWMHSCGLEV
jgi:hypothetical protein